MSNNQYEEETEQQMNHQNLTEQEVNAYHTSPIKRISNFLQEHKVSIHDFWQSDRNHASPEDIVNFCKNCGLLLSNYDVTNLKAEVFADKEIIFMQKFCELIPCWKSEGKEMVSNFLKKRSNMLVDKLLQSKEKQRAKSGQLRNRNASDRKSLMRQASALKIKKECTFKPNNSQQYLRKYREREQIQQKQLAETIEKNKIDYEYGMLLKMSELNDSNKEMKSHQTYRAYKSAEGVIKVRVFNLNRFQKEITLKEFETIYKNFKKSTKQNKEWVCLPANTGNLSQAQERRNKNNQKSQRQLQLQNLLANTVNLTNLLKEQIKIFKMKGIYGCQNW